MTVAVENRWAHLRPHEYLINSFGPPSPMLWNCAANELLLARLGHAHVLEVGCGAGRSTLPFLQRTEATMELLDVDPEMLRVAKECLAGYPRRTKFVQADAVEYLQTCEAKEAIWSSFVVHNFKQKDKARFFRAAFDKLLGGGVLLMADLIADPFGTDKKLLEQQRLRYQRHLPSDLAEEIIEHMMRDAMPDYQMVQHALREQLRQIGFERITFDRHGREALLVAWKPK